MLRRIIVVAAILAVFGVGVKAQQTTVTGRIASGTLANRPACPSASATTGDEYIITDQTPTFVYICDPTRGWWNIGVGSAIIPNTNLAFSATPAFAASASASYKMTLTANVTSSTITGTPQNGMVLSFSICQDGVGSWTFAWPASFVVPLGFVIDGSPNGCTYTTWKYDGTNWTLASSGGGGSGGGSPAGVNGDLQTKNGSSFGASHFNDTGTVLKSTEDTQFKGPNPYVDLRAYGVKYNSLGQIIQTNCTATAGSPVITTTSTLIVDNGGGVTCTQAGPAATVSAPAAPTVNSGGAQTSIGTGRMIGNATGATTYTYCIAAVDRYHGVSPCSANGSTTTGQATMGYKSGSVASWTRTDFAQGYASTLTITTTAPHLLVPGMFVSFNDGNDVLQLQNAGGTVQTVPDNTHFTLYDNRTVGNGAYAAMSTSSATFSYAVGNLITWSAVTNAFRYLIYRNGSLIGVSYPENAVNGTVANDPLRNSFEDYGSITTLPNPPPYAPGAAPVAQINEDFTSTVLSGAGTNTLTLNANATNNVAGAAAYLDNSPNLVNAITAVCGGVNHGSLFFPETVTGNFGSYQFYSIPQFNCGANAVNIIQQGNIAAYDTFWFNSGIIWTTWNSPHNSGQFAWSEHPSISTFTAYPLFYQSYTGSGGVFELRDLTLIHNASNAAMIVVKDAGLIPAGIVRDCIFTTGLGGSDVTSTEFVWRNNISGGGNIVFERSSMSSGTGPGAPLWQATGGGFPFVMRDMMFSKRGIYMGAAVGGTFENIYEQGATTPKIWSFASGGGNQVAQVTLTGSIEDTTQNPAIAYSSAIGTTMSGNIYYTGNSTWGAVMGNGLVAVSGTNAVNYNQNTNLFDNSKLTTVVDGLASDCCNQGQFGVYQNRSTVTQRVGSRSQFFVSGNPPLKPTCTAQSGGALGIGTYQIAVVPVFRGGSNTYAQGFMSQYCDGATTTGVLKSIGIDWTAVPNAVGYDLYLGPNGNGLACTTPLITGGSTVHYDMNGFAGGCTGQPRTYDGGGPTSMTVGGVGAPAVRLSNNLTTSIVPAVMTANRTVTVPDATGNIVLDTQLSSLMTAPLTALNLIPQLPYDNFNRADGGLGANWTSNFTGNGTLTITSKAVFGTNASGNTSSYYTGQTFTQDQWCEVTIASVPSGTQVGCAMRASGTTNATTNEFQCVVGNGSIQYWNITNGGFTNATSVAYGSLSVGDRLRCWVTGTSPTVSLNAILFNTNGNSTTLGPFTSSTGYVGAPGIVALKNTGSVTNWTAGNWKASTIWSDPGLLSLTDQEIRNNLHIVNGGLTVGEVPATSTGTAMATGYIYARGIVVGPSGGTQSPVTLEIALGTAVLGTGAIASGTCAAVVTVAATGVATTDVITSTFNTDPTAITGYGPAAGGSLYIVSYPTTNNVNFKVCNSTGGTITPGAATLNFRVDR